MWRRYAPYEDVFDAFKDFEPPFQKTLPELRWLPGPALPHCTKARPGLPARGGPDCFKDLE